VDVSPVFEQELLGWDGPRAAGLPDGWSGIEIHDRQVMVLLNNIERCVGGRLV